MKVKFSVMTVAILLLLGCTSALQAQKNWEKIYSDQDVSRDTIQKKGYTLIFINKDDSFDGQTIKRMTQTFFDVYPKEVKTYNKKSSKTVVIIIDPEYKGVAATSGHVVRVNPEWMRAHPEDLDVVTHETMHIVQSYPHDAGPGWITEGIADFVRNQYGVNNKAGNWSLTPFNEKQNYTNAYRITARFFVWISKNYKKDFVKKLNTAMHSGNYSDKFWKNQTGKSVDELWKEYSQNPLI